MTRQHTTSFKHHLAVKTVIRSSIASIYSVCVCK